VAEVDPQDLRTLVSLLGLRGDEVKAAHAALTTYCDAIKQGGAEARADIAATQPEGAVEAANNEVRRTQAMEAVREGIEARRRAGEFAGDDAALREALQEAAREAQEELDRSISEGDRLPGWGESFQTQASRLAQWYDDREVLGHRLRAELMAIAGEDRQAALDRWWAESAVRRAMKRGRLSAEAFDPASALDSNTLASSPLLLDAYAHWLQRHAPIVAARDEQIRRLPLIAADAVVRSQLNVWKNGVQDTLAAREAVRDHAVAGVEDFAVLLSVSEAELLRGRARRTAFPSVWRRDRAARALRAALERLTLDDAQRAMVVALQMEHDALAEATALAHQHAVMAEEAIILANQDVAQAVRFIGGERDEKSPTPALDEIKRRRRELVDDTMQRLRAMLTDAQWESLPGTRSSPVRD
jgi:hypothetical protein